MRKKEENNNLEMLGRPMTLGRKVKELRKLKHWRQQDVADNSGGLLQRPHVTRIEHDDYDNWEVETIAGLSRAFGIHPCVLLVASGLFKESLNQDCKVIQITPIDEPNLHLFFSNDWPDMSQSEKEIIHLTIRAMKQAKDKRLGKTS